MEVITPTNLRKDIFNILKGIVQSKRPVEVTINTDNGFNDGVVILDKKEYEKMQELQFLEKTGTLKTVIERMKSATDADFTEL
ncbi:MAG: type II toxin-antitoxin system Phd/YefM family antitoxin [Lactobacillus sp.]|jgi:PHD/YefM family antitoxin component YafN of YafNO toxin-antitoxin module|nr:type II toxin-antitoxin system Phd/YefM family antitoxin [Lactobacillus sp.]MCH4068151.1 type II toxin-antitoxin system Phd/YefM family antitoxin [Lactobacillus sp.]MCI1304332.1 type II toxin-antitoxin system Phd/YefM family antitoxin [Lactobacillus sp.]MCI1330082.1 type II toxin-antitoxin system Phd/YefM family antitoxin [Lactobacillus sp.]MCI1399681.1 type II toxin-antitoxin system Phd/YefM family antitoxin [Lactobacillus sp.]